MSVLKNTKIEVNPALRPWQAVAELIAQVGGVTCEAVLHDLSDPVHSVIYVVNGTVTDRQIGQGFRHLVKEMLLAQATDPQGSDVLSDWWFHWQEKLIRCVTLLIRDPSGQLIGALCVNQDVTLEYQEFGRIKRLLPGLAGVTPDLSEAEQFCLNTQNNERISTEVTQEKSSSDAGFIAPKESVLDAVYGLIDRIVSESQSSDEGGLRSKNARLDVLRFMDTRGVFLVKGAIEHAAEQLGVSKVIVYSDLDQIRRTAK